MYFGILFGFLCSFGVVLSLEHCGDESVLNQASLSVDSGPVPILIPSSVSPRTMLDMLSRANMESGERWEIPSSPATSTQDLSVFRYWLPHPTGDFSNGWTNATERYGDFANFSQCQTEKHYSMLTPSRWISAHIVNMLFPSSVGRRRDVQFSLFAACGNTATALHFDRKDNFFFHLLGRKRFYLFPPRDFAHLYFAPRNHPLYRQSLLTPLNLSRIDEHEFPRFFHRKPLAVKVVDLEPGQVLFIPGLWAHFVVSLTDTIGLAMQETLESYNPMQAFGEHEEERNRNLPLPFEMEWPLQVIFPSVRYYLDQILSEELKADLKTMYARAYSPVPNNTLDLAEFHVKLVENPVKIRAYASKLRFSLDMFRMEYCEDVVLQMFSKSVSVFFIVHYL